MDSLTALGDHQFAIGQIGYAVDILLRCTASGFSKELQLRYSDRSALMLTEQVHSVLLVDDGRLVKLEKTLS